MSTFPKMFLRLVTILTCAGLSAAAAVSPNTAVPPNAAEPNDVREAFVAAMQRVHLQLPDLPDPPALEAYAIHDYLVAARLRRDLALKPDDDLDAAIDAFVQAHF